MNQVKIPLTLNHQIEELKSLILSLQQTDTIFDRLDILNKLPIVRDYLHSAHLLQAFLARLGVEDNYVVKAVIAIGQGPVVFNMQQAGEDKFERLHRLIHQLLFVEKFYQEMGGIIGYHLTVLKMIVDKDTSNPLESHVTYIHPEGLHLDKDTQEVKTAVRWGIETLNQIAEMYPVGGAGDRLNLIDELTGVALPAAMLPFLGRSLLEGILRDLQAREYLYFKLYGHSICIPIAMMTSGEKNNHTHIVNICRKHNWFGRPPESFFFFIQPLVPVITIDGNWSLSSCLSLTLKPGGHGVIWKLAEDTGVFDWLTAQNRLRLLIRQINNPLAGTDHTLLALTGLGIKKEKSFGFASCERLLNSAEGTNVLIEKEEQDDFSYCLTNIEYTDFHQKGIGEVPAKPDSPYSIYPTNTNILFAYIPAMQQALQKNLLPGQLINMKSKVPYINPNGELSHIQGGRLESTMQNIADYLVDRFPYRLPKEKFRECLQTFITYNQRIKTISTTKKTFKKGESPFSTPDQAYYDLLSNNLSLLKSRCHFDVPNLQSIEHYLEKGPDCLFIYHSALGPLYDVIAQKLRKGKLALGAELQLEVAEIDIEGLHVVGSAIIEATCPMGHYTETGLLKYGKESRCLLHHVIIENRGINYNSPNCFWKNQIFHHESFYVLLHESAEFEAQHVVFKGDFFFEVPAHHRLRVSQDANGQIIRDLQPINQPTWSWSYTFDDQDQIKLEKVYH